MSQARSQPPIPRIRAVLFDFDGTLRHNDPGAHDFFFDHAASLGALDSPRNRKDALRWAHRYWKGDGGVVTDSESFGQDTAEFWDNYSYLYLRAFNCPEPQARDLAPRLTSHMRERYSPVHRVDDGAFETLQALREAGLTIGVVSNRDVPFTDLLDTLDLSRRIDFSLAAGEVNSWKPDPEIFRHALAMAGTGPQESLYVGDNYFADVVGARLAGLHPVLYDPETVFPEADCTVIEALAGVQPLALGHNGAG